MVRGRPRTKPGEGQSKPRADSNSSGQTKYSKVGATFKCSKSECGKTWTSFHGWGREDDGVYCEFCNVQAKLENCQDEVL